MQLVSQNGQQSLYDVLYSYRVPTETDDNIKSNATDGMFRRVKAARRAS